MLTFDLWGKMLPIISAEIVIRKYASCFFVRIVDHKNLA
jgi:hypothetical protein